MAQPPPKPTFTRYGIATSSMCIDEQGDLAVGTSDGRIMVYDNDTNLFVKQIYKDPEARQIHWMKSSNNNMLYALVRTHGVLVFRERQLIEEIPIHHIGFCGGSISSGLLTFATTIGKGEFIKRVNLETKEESTVELASEAMPMCLTSREGETVVGKEDGTLECNGDGSTKTIKLSDSPVFCIASTGDYVACGSARSPIHVITVSDHTVRSLLYPSGALACAAITFSPNGKQILAGFGDGSIRVFSVKKLQPVLVLPKLGEKTISTVLWHEKRLYAGSSESGILSFWDIE